MEPEEVQDEGLENKPEGTLEQPELETPQEAEEVEEAPAAAPEVVVTEEAIREAQRRFTPAQQRLADELRQEREQRLAMQRELESLRVRLPKTEEPKPPEDPEPDPVMDPGGYQRWVVRQEIKPLLERQKQIEERDQARAQQQKAASDYARLITAYPDLKSPESELSKTFEAFLGSSGPREQRLVGLYRAGQIEAEELLAVALGSKAPAAAEAKVKQDLVRKANAQVAGGQSKAPPGKKYASVDDVIAEAIREQMKG